MYEEFTKNRIVQLRMQRDVSARDMSLSLGQNANYINQIENGKKYPSLQGLFYICEYFGITPKEFFDEGNPQPEVIRELTENLKKLDPDVQTQFNGLIRTIANKKQEIDFNRKRASK